ncbi:gas vesicle protein GvpO, halophile-type [Haladaptatus halobius]|uniref:gas vesicle protein GvpO, halophile-type n=1 Tax=Haladaptatus halobius TaxID=2884875 RepID=UPI001D0A57A2|nr:gas vesicle protein GvpO [Haladaptatus halobius]
MSEADQCRALTESGERCSRPAEDDGFCHQHDPDDETIDDADEASRADETAVDGGEETGSESSESDENKEGESVDEAQNGDFDVMDVRTTIESVASDLVGRPLDGIIEITEDDDGWEVGVEMVERSAIPDTQDILGQYEVSLSESGDVTGYRLKERYRRGDEQER